MRKLFVLMSCILAVLAVSCKKDKLPVEFNLKTDKIEIPAEGGQGKISYELVNPVDGSTVSAKCEDGTDWITDFNYSVDGEISFTVTANEADQAREAEVTVTYSGINRSFTVVQAGKAPASNPKISFEQETIEVPAAGGDASVNYTIENPVADANMKFSVTADWITDINTDTEGKISFKVAENTEDQAREATVKVNYATAENSFTVRQAAGEVKPALSFEITIKEITEDAVTVDVIPSDKQVTYVSMLIDAATFDRYGSDEEYFQQFEMEYFKDQAEDDGISLKEYIEKHCLDSGDLKDIYVGSLDPETDYYFYAYGMTSDAVRTSDIYKVKFTTKAHEVITPEFEITFSDITSRSAVMTVKGTPESATYYFDIMQGSHTSEEILTYYREEIASFIEDGWYTDASEYWYGVLDRGEASYTYDGNLLPNTLYTGYAFGVDETTGEFTSEAKLVEFTTLDEGGDEITLEIKAEKYFIVNDLIALYPDDTELAKNKGKYMVPVELVATGKPDKLYSTYWSSDWSQESGENIITNLKGDIAGGWAYEGNNVRIFMSGGPRSILAAAESEGELVAPTAVYLGSMNDDGASPASEYVPAGAPAKTSILRSRLLEKAKADVSYTHRRIRTNK